jgi:DNA helicase HerA-like ATPase
MFWARDREPIELRLQVPESVRVTRDLSELMLLSSATTGNPVSFEMVATSKEITFQLVGGREEVNSLRDQLRTSFPDVVPHEQAGRLRELWSSRPGDEHLIVDFGLSNEFMRPLSSGRFDPDPLGPVVGVLGGVEEGEVAIVQVLFSPAWAPWSENVMRAVGNGDGGSFFSNAPDFLSLAAEKVSRPLFGVAIRFAAKSPSSERPMALARAMVAALRQFGRPVSNELIPLENDGYPDPEHEQDLLARQSRRQGMILNLAELASLVHLPSTSVRHPKLDRKATVTKRAPAVTRGHPLTLGDNSHEGDTVAVTLPSEARLRHIHVVGATGTGKSTLLLNLMVQDAEHGNGFALLDPHGDLVDEVLARLPERREADVVLVDPSDPRPVGFNIFQVHSELERTLLASDLVAVFRRLSTSWGDQMHSVLANSILAFLESDRGGTLADLRRFLVEPEYRASFLTSVRDEEVRYYWTKEFPLLAGKPQAPILTRLDTFLRPKVVRTMVASLQNTIDISRIIRDGQILLVKLSQGTIGEENAALLGSLFVSQIHLNVLARQAQRPGDRRPFFLYLDEFQHFVTPSMATLLTGARKFGLGLVLAHQELRQLVNQDKDVAAAVLNNAATRVAFRCGEEDAKRLAEGFSTFSPQDIQGLARGEAVCRLDRADWDFNLRTRPFEPLQEQKALENRERISVLSRSKYGAGQRVEAPQSDRAMDEMVNGQRAPPAPPPVSRPNQSTPEPTVSKKSAALPGRGGPRHKYLQELIRRWAESKQYRVDVERSVLSGTGSVDVSLERDGRSIACEIMVTTPVEHEIGNVAKCLAAGYDEVFAIVAEQSRFASFEKALKASLSTTERTRVHVVSPDEFFGALETRKAEVAQSQTIRGYRVEVKHRAAREGLPARERMVAETVIGALRRMKSQGGPPSDKPS